MHILKFRNTVNQTKVWQKGMQKLNQQCKVNLCACLLSSDGKIFSLKTAKMCLWFLSLWVELHNNNILDSHCVIVEINRIGILVPHYNVPFPLVLKLPNTKQFTCSAQLGCTVWVKPVKIFISKKILTTKQHQCYIDFLPFLNDLVTVCIHFMMHIKYVEIN